VSGVELRKGMVIFPQKGTSSREAARFLVICFALCCSVTWLTVVTERIHSTRHTSQYTKLLTISSLQPPEEEVTIYLSMEQL